MGRLITHCIEAAKEPNGAPSSARVYAGILLVAIPLLQFMVVSAIMARLLLLDPAIPSAPTLTSSYLGFLRSFLLWTLLFDASTALSLYGINVWKYIVALRTGVAPKDDVLPDPGVCDHQDVVPPTTNGSSSTQAPKDVTPATTNGSSSGDVEPSGDRT